MTLAEGFDGSLVFNTKLDNGDMIKGADEIKKMISDLVSAVSRMGQSLDQAFGQVLPVLRSVAASTADISARLGGAATQAAEANERVAASEARATQSAQSTSAAINQQIAAVSSSRAAVSGLEREVASLSAGLRAVSQSAETGFNNGKAVLAFDAKLTDLSARVQSARERLLQFADTRIPTAQYQALTAAMDTAAAQLEKLIAKQNTYRELGVRENSRQWRSLELQIAQVEQKVNQYADAVADLERRGEDYTRGADTAAFARMSAALDSVEAGLNRNKALIDQEALAQARLNVLTAQEAVAAAKTTQEREAAVSRLREAQQVLHDLVASMSNGGQTAPVPEVEPNTPDAETTSAWARFADVIRGIGVQALKASGRLAKIPVTALAKRVQSYTRQTRQASLSTSGLVKALTSFKRLLITRIKRTFISAVFNSVNAALGQLSQFSGSFHQVMMGIKNAAAQVGGNLAVSIGSVIQALSPMISSFLGMLNSAVVAVNRFFAVLSGQSSMIVAKKQTEGYAESLSDAGSAAKNASRQLMGFDEITRLESQDASSGAGASAGAADMFEEVDLGRSEMESWGEALSTTLDTLLEGLPATREKLLGFADGVRQVGEKLHDAFTFPGLREKVIALGEELAWTLQDFVVNFPWDTIGLALGAGISLALAFVVNAIGAFNWTDLGNGIAQFINGAVSQINWSDLGRWLFVQFKIAIEVLAGLLLALDMPQLAAAAGNIVTGFFNSVTETFEKINWQALGHQIAVFFESVDWAGTAEACFRALGAAFAAAAGFLWGLIKDAWQAVVDWWHDKAFNEDGQFTIQGLLDGIVKALKDIGEWIKEHIFRPFMDGFKRVFGIHSPSTVMEEQGNYLVEGLLNGITGLWKKITQFFSDALSDLKQSLSDAWINIKETAVTVWGKTKTAVSEKFELLKSVLEQTADKLKTELSERWSSVKTTASKKWDEVRSTASEKFTLLKTALTETAGGIETNLAEKWNSLKKTTTEKWNSLKTDVTDLWKHLRATLAETEWTSIGSNLVSGLKSGISSAWSGLKSTVTGLAAKLTTTLKDKFDINSPSKVWAEIGGYLDAGLRNGIERGERGVIQTVSNLAACVSNTLEGRAVEKEINVASAFSDKLTGSMEALIAALQAVSEISFRIPDIAAGTVIPYRVAAAVAAPPANAVSGFRSGREESYTEILDEILRVLRSGMHVTLDGREIARNTAKHMSAMRRANTLNGW